MAADREEQDRAERASRDALANMRLPAGLEDEGRDRDLVHDPDAHPTGARADSRHSVPGTVIPGGASAAGAGGEETKRVRDAVAPKEDRSPS